KGWAGWLLVFTMLIALLAVRVVYSSIFPACRPDFGGLACDDPHWAFSIVSACLLASDIALILLRKKMAKPLSIVLCVMMPAALIADWVWVFAQAELDARRVLED